MSFAIHFLLSASVMSCKFLLLNGFDAELYQTLLLTSCGGGLHVYTIGLTTRSSPVGL
jgi:hypothetical protein